MRFIIGILALVLLDHFDCYENLCRKSSTTLILSSTYNGYVANSANDGNLATTVSFCSHTDINQNIAWLQVDFGKSYSINNVTIYYRKEGNTGMQPIRFRQFYLDVSNSSATQSSTVQRVRCFTDTTTAPNVPPHIITMLCRHTARYVIVESTYDPPDDGPYTGAILEICEIQVYGCENGKYGEHCVPCQGCETCDINTGQCEECMSGRYGHHCTYICGHCLNGKPCHLDNGICDQGCDPGYQAPYCVQACNGGMYGTNCSVTCGNCLDNEQCHHINGTCINGCGGGYKGFDCTEECEDYFFGENCEKRCNSTCLNCNKISGECEYGCLPGWFGRFCQEVCFAGHYGEQCNNSCGHCLNNSACDHVTGVCQQGCEPGYHREHCTEACNGGMYGTNCSVTCGNCLDNEQCHHINGTCINGCGGGYKGFDCTEECEDYFFGENCEKRCNSSCRNCNKISGECEYGCHPGWFGRFCQDVCVAGHYGEQCNNSCGHCLNNSACDHVTGVCQQGCEPGYHGEHCTETCKGGMYGTNCSVTCGNCLDNEQCHHINGTCINGCGGGYKGFDCTEECEDYFFGENCEKRCNSSCRNCNKISGECEYGCHPGWFGRFCQEVCVAGHYGEQCNNSCGHCLNNSACDHVTGVCQQGCEPGYHGEHCTETCNGGMYGTNCSVTCGNCLDNEQCHHINGTCINGCGGGYKGFDCTEECEDYFFGENCEKRCNSSCRNCNKISGECEYGCHPGWFGRFCQEVCVAGHYGEQCNNSCGHCLNNSACDHVTGVCQQGCEPGYHGEHCTETCNGGMYGTNCSVTCGNCLDNEQCHHINGTCINGCGGGYKGFDCTEECEDYFFGENCEKRCNSTCRNCNKISGKCEYGCHPGWFGRFCQEVCSAGHYGEQCNNGCGHCLNNSACDHVTGVCQEGCEPGYHREHCTEACNGGMYGTNCSVTCGNCLDNEQCHHINGTCINGCGGGYKGFDCTEECEDYFFGENCEKRCNSSCRNCNKILGECEYGCHPGWFGRFCQEVCVAGHYGEQCNNSCGHCLNNSACDHVTGVCQQGCEPGYHGEHCTETCHGGMYGTNCSVTCGNCLDNEQCHHINGTCINGCGGGYKGFDCTEECEDYFFGENCEKRCNSTCRNCNKISGECEYGCHPGWFGRFCQEVCVAGHYGEQCNNSCGHCLNNSACDHVTGVCQQGCEPGYQGEHCTEACNGGMYGTNCSVTCGNCLDNEQCNHINGTCINGCGRGYKGFDCTEECEDYFFGEYCAKRCNSSCKSCNKISGECEYGCHPGWFGRFCQEVCFAGHYGEQCNNSCGHCLNTSACDHVTGVCQQGCEPGYHGEHCTEACNGGMYGTNCSVTCGNCLDNEQCHHINGTCINGCGGGYKGFDCTEECEDYFFGEYCAKRCNSTCRNCNKISGECEYGCLPGWFGRFCQEVCVTGHYGEQCNNSCGHCLNNSACDHVTGVCQQGCEPGYHEENCTEACNGGMYGTNCSVTCGNCLDNEQCHHINGSCINGCDNKYQGLRCIEDILQILQFKSNGLELHENKPAWFELQVLSHTAFEVEWFHDGYIIASSPKRFRFTSIDMKNATSFHTLHIDRVLQRDKGQWKIAVSNNVTYTTRTVTVTVIPELVLQMNPRYDFSIQSGDEIYLQCTVTNPESLNYVTKGNLAFLKNGITFTESVKYTNFSIIMRTLKATKDDSGRYTCMHSGYDNQVSVSVNMIVIEPQQKRCQSEQRDGMLWVTTPAGTLKREHCPGNETGFATRFCNPNGIWGSPSFVKCVKEALMSASTQLGIIIEDAIQNTEKIRETVNNTLQVINNLTSSKGGISPGDLSSSMDILEKIVNVTNSTGVAIEHEVFYAVVDNILSSNNTRSWSTVSEETEKDASSLLKTMERLSDILIQNSNITTTQFSGSNFELKIDKINKDQANIRFPDQIATNLSENLEDTSTYLELPKQGRHSVKEFNYVAVIYKTMTDILPSGFSSTDNEDKQRAPEKLQLVISPVLSLTPQSDLGELNPPLYLTFKHVKMDHSLGAKHNQIESKGLQVLCVSWDFAISKWTDRGCTMNQSDHSTTSCQCSHLTNFAILMRPYSAIVKDKQSLKTMSVVGVILSVLFIALTFITYVRIWRFIKSDQNIIMLNLCCSLFLSYVMFLSAVERTDNEGVCIAITAILHYLFLVTFFSMLGMGVYYFMSITVTYYVMYVANNFKSKSRIRLFLLAIWGCPVIITLTNVGAFWGKKYHLEFYCWLSMESGSLYMFIIPVGIIVLLNIAIIVSLVRILFASSAMTKSSLQKKATYGLRSLGTLLPFLGVTWLFGILAVNENVDIFQYIFVIANSFQGFFIFISHVVMNKKVMQALRNEYCAFSDGKSITDDSKKESTSVSASQPTSKSFKVKQKGIIERIRAVMAVKSKVKNPEEFTMEETLSTTDSPTSLSHEQNREVSENEQTLDNSELATEKENTNRRFRFLFNFNPWRKKYTLTEL